MRYRTRKNMKFQFDEGTRRIIYYRDDESCIFCRRQYHMENKDPMLYRSKGHHALHKQVPGRTWRTTERNSRLPVPSHVIGQRQ